MFAASYAEDSLFTLGSPQIAGVLVLAALQGGLVFWAVLRAGEGRTMGVRLVLALAGFWLFEWLSPQAFYAYYRAIIPGLPAQWVIGWPPRPAALAELAFFQGPASLSAHGRGALFWVLLVTAVWRRRNAAN